MSIKDLELKVNAKRRERKALDAEIGELEKRISESRRTNGFTKSDLRAGMVVILMDGMRYQVIGDNPDTLSFFSGPNVVKLKENYTDELMHTSDYCLSVLKVHEYQSPDGLGELIHEYPADRGRWMKAWGALRAVKILCNALRGNVKSGNEYLLSASLEKRMTHGMGDLRKVLFEISSIQGAIDNIKGEVDIIRNHANKALAELNKSILNKIQEEYDKNAKK